MCDRFGSGSAACLLLVAIAIFSYELSSLAPLKGWWLDEYFSLWSTDPSNSFMHALADRFRDTTPPLYYTALFWFRRLIDNERYAVLCLNLFALAVAVMAVCLASRKSATVGWALAGSAVFLCSGPVLSTVMEGRTYLLGLAVTFVISWFCALAVEVRDSRPGLTAFALVGAVAGLTHLYAALFCCCCAAGLMLLGAYGQRRDLMRPALAMGVTAGVITLAFLAWVIDLAPTWIAFSYGAVVTHLSNVSRRAFGSTASLAFFVAMFVSAFFLSRTRPLAVVFASALALFVTIPVLASFWRPIITAQYWAIGASSVIVLVVFWIRALPDRRFPMQSFRSCWAVAFACAVFLLVTDFGGYSSARFVIFTKPNWSGAELVASHIADCPSGSVHIYPGVFNLFAIAAHAPEAVFVDAKSSRDEPVSAAAAKCPVLGWAEHIFHGERSNSQENFVLNASDEELLHILHIDASPDQVRIDRHWSGYVVTRR